MPALTSLVPQLTTTLRYASANPIFSTSASVTVFYATAITLNSFDNYSEYTGLFDQYRIDDVEVWIDAASPGLASTASTNVGQLFTAVDLDDNTAPSSIVQVESKPGACVTTGMVGHYHRWKPHMAVAVYSGTFTSFANAPSNWIDSASPGVAHYGIKLAHSLTDSVYKYNVMVRAKVSFRAPGI
jgi:hypothetical protein